MIQTRVTIPRNAAARMLLELEQSSQGTVFVCGAGQRRRPGYWELLVRPARTVNSVRSEVNRVVRSGLHPVLISGGKHAPSGRVVNPWWREIKHSQAKAAGILALVAQRDSLRTYACLEEDWHSVPLDVVSLPGRWMHSFRPGPLAPLTRESIDEHRNEKSRSANQESRKNEATGASEEAEDGEARLSRQKAFLGKGDLRQGTTLIERAAHLLVAIVGCGGAGSALAYRLAQAGVGSKSGLVIIDGDQVEEANRGTMLLPPAAVGMPKAEAVAAMASGFNPGARIVPIVGTISDSEAADAVTSADVVFSCVDRDEARIGVAALATRFFRPHFDLSAGTAFTRSRDAAWGGDIRVGLPGSRGCVGCMTNLDVARAVKALSLAREQEVQLRQQNDPFGERPGSWSGLIDAVVGQATLLFWRLFLGELGDSIWLHLDANGVEPRWGNWTRRQKRRCRLCSASGIAGLGDLRGNL